MVATVSEGDARYACELVSRICAEVGPGLPGSPQERERAAIIGRELELHLGRGNVVLEEFTVAPGAFLGAQAISTVLMLIAVLLNVLMPHVAGVPPGVTAILALAASAGAVLLFICEFVLGLEVVDFLFKKQQSVNVIGTLRKPGGQAVKRLLILSGHHDSAVEFTWLRLTGYGFFVLTVTWVFALVTVLMASVIQTAGVVAGSADVVRMGTLGWLPIVYPIAPAVAYVMLFSGRREGGGIVPGAVDNLSACALTVAMCSFLAQNPSHVPDDTEIRFITFGSEEAGVRGSRRYVERHFGDLRSLDVRLLNYEMIASPRIAILTSEANGTVKNSPEMVRSVVAAAQRAEVPYRLQAATLGTSNDAGRFSRAGLKATTLLGLTMQQMVAFYHQRWDTPAALTIEPLLNVLKITSEWVRVGGR